MKRNQPQYFSDHFKIDKAKLKELGVFNPILNFDTKVFVDPLLLKKSSNEIIRNAAKTFDDFFITLLNLVKILQHEEDKPWREAKRRVKFPEYKYTCIGYGADSINGSGSGAWLNDKILKSAKDIVSFAKDDPKIFLILPLLEEGIIGTNQPDDTTTQKRNGLIKKFELVKEVNFHPENERIKHRYFDKVIHRFGKNEATLRKIVSAVYVFEEFSNFKDFKLFKYEDAKEFQKYLLERYNHSMQTAYRTMQAVQEFFLWLKEQSGYKKLEYDDIKSLRLSLKDTEKAKTSKPRKTIDLEKWEEMVLNIKPKDELELRGRAMFVCLLLTGIRIDALISLKIGDLNLERNYLFQDSNHVNTKFSSSHKTNLWNLRSEIKKILVDWVYMLRNEHGFTDEDPLFPHIQITTNECLQFEKDGFKKEFLKQPDVVRKELAKQFENANLDYHTPHTIRNSITDLFMSCDLTMEQIKAVSQNLSHKSLETTFNSYYNMPEVKKDQIIEELDIENLRKIKKIRNNPKYKFIMSQLNDEKIVNKVFKMISEES